MTSQVPALGQLAAALAARGRERRAHRLRLAARRAPRAGASAPSPQTPSSGWYLPPPSPSPPFLTSLPLPLSLTHPPRASPTPGAGAVRAARRGRERRPRLDCQEPLARAARRGVVRGVRHATPPHMPHAAGARTLPGLADQPHCGHRRVSSSSSGLRAHPDGVLMVSGQARGGAAGALAARCDRLVLEHGPHQQVLLPPPSPSHPPTLPPLPLIPPPTTRLSSHLASPLPSSPLSPPPSEPVPEHEHGMCSPSSHTSSVGDAEYARHRASGEWRRHVAREAKVWAAFHQHRRHGQERGPFHSAHRVDPQRRAGRGGPKASGAALRACCVCPCGRRPWRLSDAAEASAALLCRCTLRAQALAARGHPVARGAVRGPGGLRPPPCCDTAGAPAPPAPPPKSPGRPLGDCPPPHTPTIPP